MWFRHLPPGCQENNSSRDEIYEKNSRIHLDRLQNKFTPCKGIRNNTGSRQTAGIQEQLDTTCKQNASWRTAQDNETLFPNWQKESWQTSEETSRYVRPERVNKWPNSMTAMWWWWWPFTAIKAVRCKIIFGFPPYCYCTFYGRYYSNTYCVLEVPVVSLCRGTSEPRNVVYVRYWVDSRFLKKGWIPPSWI